MATLYEIYIDGPADHQKDIKDVLSYIAGNPVGRVILAAIEAKSNELFGKEMKIVPYSDEDRKRGCNATTRPDSLEDSAPEGVDWFLGKRDDPNTPVDERTYTVNENDRVSKSKSGRKRILGTGLGSGTEVHFTASMWGESACAGALYAKMPDEVLLHEMVHGLRHMQGLSNEVPTENVRYKNEEEFLAIVVTNVYMSAKGSTQLRADYYASTQLKPPLNTSAGFLTDRGNLQLMQQYHLLWQPTFQELARVGTPDFPVFNPFREVVKNEAVPNRPATKKPVPYWGNDDKDYKEWRGSKF